MKTNEADGKVEGKLHVHLWFLFLLTESISHFQLNPITFSTWRKTKIKRSHVGEWGGGSRVGSLTENKSAVFDLKHWVRCKAWDGVLLWYTLCLVFCTASYYQRWWKTSKKYSLAKWPCAVYSWCSRTTFGLINWSSLL